MEDKYDNTKQNGYEKFNLLKDNKLIATITTFDIEGTKELQRLFESCSLIGIS